MKLTFFFRNLCISLAGSSTSTKLEIRFMTGLQFSDLARSSKPLFPPSPSDDR